MSGIFYESDITVIFKLTEKLKIENKNPKRQRSAYSSFVASFGRGVLTTRIRVMLLLSFVQR